MLLHYSLIRKKNTTQVIKKCLLFRRLRAKMKKGLAAWENYYKTFLLFLRRSLQDRHARLHLVILFTLFIHFFISNLNSERHYTCKVSRLKTMSTPTEENNTSTSNEVVASPDFGEPRKMADETFDTEDESDHSGAEQEGE